jgi:hypothetical protein
VEGKHKLVSFAFRIFNRIIAFNWNYSSPIAAYDLPFTDTKVAAVTAMFVFVGTILLAARLAREPLSACISITNNPESGCIWEPLTRI